MRYVFASSDMYPDNFSDSCPNIYFNTPSKIYPDIFSDFLCDKFIGESSDSLTHSDTSSDIHSDSFSDNIINYAICKHKYILTGARTNRAGHKLSATLVHPDRWGIR